MAPRRKIDWEAIESAYRAGVQSICAIARDHECSEAAIRRKAELGGWTRDLSAKVRIAAQARTRANSSADLTEQQIIDTEADAMAAVIKRQRAGFDQLRDLKERLSARLASQLDEDKTLKGTNLAVKTLESLASTDAKVVALERQSWNMDGGDGAAEEPKIVYIDRTDEDA